MDFQLKRFPKFQGLPLKQDGLRLVAQHAPRAEALAASWIGRVRPFFSGVYALRRKLATFAVALLAGLLFLHVMFGANGMVVYKQKRAEYESLRKKVLLEQKENELYTQKIQSLKTDKKAFKKKARKKTTYPPPGV